MGDASLASPPLVAADERTSDSDDVSSGSEFECESGSERMIFKNPHAHQQHRHALPTLSQTPRLPGMEDTATLPNSNVRWPKRLVAPKNGLGDARLACVDEPFYYMVIDVETSGSIWCVHTPVAVACAVLCVVMRHDHWEVRVVETHLATYPQQDVVFEQGILEPGGFWHRHRQVLEMLDAQAKRNALSAPQVTAALALWWDDAMMRYNYPHVWTDNSVFDAGQLSMLFGMHLGRPGLAFVRHPHLPNEYIYARPPQHTNIISMDLIHPCFTHMVDHSGAPSLLNFALKHQALGKLSSIKYDHNPLNDVQRVALNFGRLLCRWTERRTMYPARQGMHIDSYLEGGIVPLPVEAARPVHYSIPSMELLSGIKSLASSTPRKSFCTAQDPTGSSSAPQAPSRDAYNNALSASGASGKHRRRRRPTACDETNNDNNTHPPV